MEQTTTPRDGYKTRALSILIVRLSMRVSALISQRNRHPAIRLHSAEHNELANIQDTIRDMQDESDHVEWR